MSVKCKYMNTCHVGAIEVSQCETFDPSTNAVYTVNVHYKERLIVLSGREGFVTCQTACQKIIIP